MKVQIEVEDKIFDDTEFNNGAGPLWCMGSSCLTRIGDNVFATGMELIPGATDPLSNSRWLLFKRGSSGWDVIYRDEHPTREPSPLLSSPDGRVIVSAHPSLPPLEKEEAKSQIVEFSAAQPDAEPIISEPVWNEDVSFYSHSYRNVAADAQNVELILFVNRGYDRAYWSFRDGGSNWSSSGQLFWPWGDDYEEPQPIRLCYNTVQIRNRAVYVVGTSDIVEPVKAWKDFKHKLTGRQWDYDFRRVFFTWTPDIATEPFRPWNEIASREATAGHAQICDLWVDENSVAHLIWRERSVDVRLREAFFPDERLTYSVRYTIVRDGEVIAEHVLAEGGEGLSSDEPQWARWHVASDGSLYAILTVDKGAQDKSSPIQSTPDAGIENRLIKINQDGSPGESIVLPLKHPFMPAFCTASARGGAVPSDTIDLMGVCHGIPGQIRYARIRLGS